MEPETATDDPDRRAAGGSGTPRLWLVRPGPGAADGEPPQGPPPGDGGDGGGGDNGDVEALPEPVPRAQIEAIIVAGERGAARIMELSDELAERAAEVARCRAELIVARRTAELLRLRRETAEIPDRIEPRVVRLRAAARALVGRMQRAA